MARLYTQRRFERDKALVDYIERYGIDLENPNAHLDEKHDEIWVRILGYKSLRIASDDSGHAFEYAGRCEPPRLTAAVRKQYELARTHLEEVEKGVRKVLPNTVEDRLKIGERIEEQKQQLELALAVPPPDYYEREQEADLGRGANGKLRRHRRGPKPFSQPFR